MLEGRCSGRIGSARASLCERKRKSRASHQAAIAPWIGCGVAREAGVYEQ